VSIFCKIGAPGYTASAVFGILTTLATVCAIFTIDKVIFNPRRACAMVTVVILCVCVCVCVSVCLSVTMLTATYIVYKPKIKYLSVLCGIFKVCIVWIC
jgi:hypothetical protein